MSVESGSTSAIGVSTGGGRGGVATASPVAARGGGVESMSHAVSISPDIKVSAPKTDTVSIKFGLQPDTRPFAATLNSHNIPLEGPSHALKDTQKFTAPKENHAPQVENKPTTEKAKSAMKVEVWNPAIKNNPSGKESTYKFSLDTNKGKDALKNLQVETKGQKTETSKVEINLPSHLKTEKGVVSPKNTERSIAELPAEDVKASVSEALPRAENPSAMPDTVTKNIAEMKTEKVEEVTGDIQALKGEVVSAHKESISPEVLKAEYTRLYIESQAAPNEKSRMAVEKVDKMPKVKPDGVVKDGRIKIDATISAMDFNNTNIQGVRLYEAIVAYNKSVGRDNPQTRSEAFSQTLEAVDQAHERTGTKEAAIQGYEMVTQDETAEQEEQSMRTQTVTAERDEVDSETNTATQTDLLEEAKVEPQTAVLPDTFTETDIEEETEVQTAPETSAETEVLSEQEILTETTTQGSTVTQRTTMIQGDQVIEEITLVKFVNDEDADAATKDHALQAAQPVYDARIVSGDPFVQGSEIAPAMPSNPQVDKAQSQLAKDLLIDDRRYPKVLFDISQLGKMTSLGEVDANVSKIIAQKPAVKVVEEREVIAKPVTQRDVQRVLGTLPDEMPQAA